ncbi:MAG: hypothetical protein ACE5G1_13720, partial [bacterium]
MRRTRFIMLMTLLAFFALFAITDAVPGQPLPQSQESKKMEITLPVIGTKIPISEEHKMPLLIAGILFVLVYYVPKAYVSMRDSLSKIKSQRAMLELERTRFELLKTKYEIEALKKQHKLGDITLSERVETTIT